MKQNKHLKRFSDYANSYNVKPFIPRDEMLREVEGWYTTPTSPLYEMYEKSGSKLKYSRWLTANGIDVNGVVGKSLINAAKPITFKFSCRHNDIIRCSIMHKKMYFDSCLQPRSCNDRAPIQYCNGVTTDDGGEYIAKRIAILYVPDAAGHIKARCFMVKPWLTSPTIIPLRFYGESQVMQVCVNEFYRKWPSCMPVSKDRAKLSYAQWDVMYKNVSLYMDTTCNYEFDFKE